MRKMIFMAIAGFLWRKFMARGAANATVPGGLRSRRPSALRTR
jgi:hypothetical protein